MRARLILFFGLVIPALCVVPAFNVLTAPTLDTARLSTRSFLFNLDVGSRAVAELLYQTGLSIDPQQVIIGRDGWLHLGDKYERAITRDRTPYRAADSAKIEQAHAAVAEWDRRLASYGVKVFRVMVGPNKGSIYPETLPQWAKPAKPNFTDALLAEQSAPLYVDLRTALLAARAHHEQALYYRTDTHWNELGAAIALREFARRVAPAAPELRWPGEPLTALVRVDPRNGGDLTGFLRMRDRLVDVEPRLALVDEPIKTTQIDFDSGRIIRQGDNPEVERSAKPLLVNSPSALNDKKLLWVRDSFGTALSPLVAATFRQTLQIHPAEAFRPGGELLRLVESWKPDYVFVTVAEREAASTEMVQFPLPILTRPLSRDALATASRPAARLGAQKLAPGHDADERLARGDSPSLKFGWSESNLAPAVHWVALQLHCSDGSPAVPVRLAWSTPSGGNESAELLLQTGNRALDLRSLPGWSVAGSLQSFELTLDTRQGCSRFTLADPLLIDLPDARP